MYMCVFVYECVYVCVYMLCMYVYMCVYKYEEKGAAEMARQLRVLTARSRRGPQLLASIRLIIVMTGS